MNWRKKEVEMPESISVEILSELFELSDTDQCVLARTEDEMVEYKKGFSFDDKLMITIAGFANNRGGFILHGVENGSRKLVGLTDKKSKDFERYDLADATTRLNSKFSPKITIVMELHEVCSLKIGVIHVHKSEEKPVVAISGGRDIREGAIYYSYGAVRTEIKYAELRSLLDAVLQRKVTQLFKHLNLIARIGVENAAIMDVVGGDVFGPSIKSFVISEELLDQLTFVREGEFSETEGAPTLKLVGNLQSYDAEARIEVRTRISEEDIYSAFLNQESIHSPFQYIEASCDQLSQYFPIYYYARRAGLSRNSLREKVKQITDARKTTKERILTRIGSETRLHVQHSVSNSKAYRHRNKYRQDLINEQEITIDIDLATHLISAIRTLSSADIKPSHVLEVLSRLFEVREKLEDIQFSNLRKAICHIDYKLNCHDES